MPGAADGPWRWRNLQTGEESRGSFTGLDAVRQDACNHAARRPVPPDRVARMWDTIKFRHGKDFYDLIRA